MSLPRDILVTTTKERFSELFTGFRDKLTNNGLQLIHIPTIKITPTKSWVSFHHTLRKINYIDTILFTSQYAVQIFAKKIKDLQALASFSQKKWLVIGSQTKQKLKTALPFVNNIFTPQVATTESLLILIREKQLAKNYFWFPCSNLSDNKILDFVKFYGGKCIQDIIYYNTFPLESEHLMQRYFTYKLPCWIVFTSPSSFVNFVGALAENANMLQNIKIATIGDTTAKFIRQEKFKVHFIASKGMKQMLEFIIESEKYCYATTKNL